MSVIIYRNRLNEEMKRFGSFSKTITKNLDNYGIKVSIIFNDIKEKCLKEMQDHDTIIIITHGSKNALYHRYDNSYGNHQTLISANEILNKDVDVLNAIADKKIIAISCATTQELAEIACNQGKCKTYLGFKHKIHVDKQNKKTPSSRYHDFLIKCYKEAFSRVLEKAIKENWKFSKFALVLEIELKKTVVKNAQDFPERGINFYKNHGIDQAIIAISNVAENIEIFGDKSQLIN
ncbi:MAG: hypothetical protein AB7E42_07390 [Anaerotignaceae bacterium]